MRNDYDDDRPVKTKTPAKKKPASGAAKRPASSAAKSAKAGAVKKPVSAKPRAEQPKRASSASRRDDYDRPRTRRDDYDRPRTTRRDDDRPRRRPDDYDRPARRPSGAKKRRKRSSGGMAFLWMVVAVVVAFAISMFLHNNVFEVVRMTGDSMYATLRRGDMVIVNKLAKGPIDRGDIVAVDLHGETGYIIRRVVGLPGETVSIEEGKTYIDGNPISERYIGLETYDSFGGMTLPSGKYYILCDNRTDLSDSRATDIAMVDRDEIAGTASFRIWPLGRFGAVK